MIIIMNYCARYEKYEKYQHALWLDLDVVERNLGNFFLH